MSRRYFAILPLNLTYLHCMQHSFFEHLFNLYYNLFQFSKSDKTAKVTRAIDFECQKRFCEGHTEINNRKRSNCPFASGGKRTGLNITYVRT